MAPTGPKRPLWVDAVEKVLDCPRLRLVRFDDVCRPAGAGAGEEAQRAVNSPDPAIQSGYIKSQFPMMYDLSSDPHEDNNLSYTDLTNGVLLAPALKAIAEYERSVREYPNIKVGEDFTGYNK